MFHVVGIGLTIDVIWDIGWGLRESQEPLFKTVSVPANVSTGCLQKTNQRLQRLSRLIVPTVYWLAVCGSRDIFHSNLVNVVFHIGLKRSNFV